MYSDPKCCKKRYLKFRKNLISLLTFFKGVRPFGRKVVLLVTDGHSNMQRSLTIPKAEALKRNGVFIYVIAVGGTFISGIDEMVKMASRPPEQFLFRVSGLSGLVEVIKLVVKQVAPGKYKIINGQPNKPCHHHG